MAVTKLICHRGYSAVYPENTMLAFQKAIEEGCIGFELDIRSTSDGVLYVMHDSTLDRTTDGTGSAYEATWEYVSGLDAGSWMDVAFVGERVPSFEQVLDYFRGKNVFLMIEIEENYNGFDDVGIRASRMIQSKQMEHQCLFMSLTAKKVFEGKAIIPTMSTGIIVGSGTDPADSKAFALAAHFDFIVLSTVDLTDIIIADMQASGLKVFVYCPATVVGIQAVVDMGADGILSNYADNLMTIAGTNSIVQDTPIKTFKSGVLKVHDGLKFKTARLKNYEIAHFKDSIIKG